MWEAAVLRKKTSTGSWQKAENEIAGGT